MKGMLSTRLTLAATLIAASAVSPAVLAESSSNNQGSTMFRLYQQIEDLKQQVRKLNGDVDTLKHQLQQSEQGQRQNYQDLDARLSKLEDSDSDDDSETDEADSEVREAYKAGFEKLKDGQYDEAISAFKDFLDEYPDSDLTANAWYWLGETYYTQHENDKAQSAFETVVDKFGDSDKVPGSLYKIALVQMEKKQDTRAQATLEELLDQYPDADVASKAKEKLESLQED